MNTDKQRVLIVDDSADDIHFVMANLTDQFAVLVATSGEKALEIASKDPFPDVILMDVEMPVMNGYDTCMALKENAITKDIDVIFVSSHDTTEEKLAGYDAGGSDYLIKPVQPEELLQKIKLSLVNKSSRASSSEAATSAMQTAMTAMTHSGELGVIIDFLRNSFLVKSGEDLASLITSKVSQYGLENTVRIEISTKPYYSSSRDYLPPLEMELLSRINPENRITEKGNRLILNFGPVTLLIKNLPEDDDKRGRLRDHLAIMTEGAEARVKTLTIATELTDIVEESNLALKHIGSLQQQQKKDAMQIMDDLMEDIEEKVFSFGLTEEQETVLVKSVQNAVNKSLDNFEKGLEIDEDLHSIIDHLSNTLRQS